MRRVYLLYFSFLCLSARGFRTGRGQANWKRTAGTEVSSRKPLWVLLASAKPAEDDTDDGGSHRISSVEGDITERGLNLLSKPKENDGTDYHDWHGNGKIRCPRSDSSASEPSRYLPATVASTTTTLALATLAIFTVIVSCDFLPEAFALDQVDQTILGVPLPVPDMRYFVAGGCCAAASHGATCPIDVVKTKIQADPATYQGKSVLDSAVFVLQNEGPGALLKGLGPTIAGYGLEGAAKFGLYESAKPIFAGITGDIATGYLGASVTAGAVASLFLCPLEQTRIRLVTDSDYATSMLPAMARLGREEGWRQFFLGGCPAMLSKQVPYTYCKQVSFDVLAGTLYGVAASNWGLEAAAIKTEVSLGAAFLASILACIASHPGDVILTQTYKKGGRSTNVEDSSKRMPKFTDVVSTIYAKNGIGGFFTGLTARFVHVGAIITTQLYLYDVIKQLLGLPATGT